MLHRLIYAESVQHLLKSVVPLFTGHCRPTSRVQDDVIRVDDICAVDVLRNLVSFRGQRTMYSCCSTRPS